MAAKYNSTSLDEQDLAEEINEQFLLAKRYLDSIHERMNLQEELYRTYIDKNSYPHSARVFDPRVFRIIETITPRMVANEPTGSFYPQEGGDTVTTQIFNSMMQYDWRRADMFQKQVMFIKSMLIFGTAFGRTHWDFRQVDKTRMEPQMINGRMVWTPKSTKTVKVTEFDGPNFEVLNIYDCFPDPNANSVQNMRWFIYRIFKTIEELEAENDAGGAEYWKNLGTLKAAIKAKADEKAKAKAAGGRPNDLQFREHRRVMLSTQELIGEDESNPDITILVRFTKKGWCYYCPEFQGYGDFSGIIREVDNPYFHGELPIVCGVDYPYPGELYGMGEIEPLDRIQRAINAVLNQRLDNVQLTLRNMWKVKKNSGVDLHTLVSAPGNVVTTDDMSAVEALQVPDVTGATFVQTMNYLTAAMQNGSGVTDYTQGIQSDQNVTNNTATGIRLVQQEANAQFKLKIQLYNHMVVSRIANQWKDLRIQYTTEAQVLRIVGADTVKYLLQKTQLHQQAADGTPILPGTDVKSKLQVSSDGTFAFLNLLPEDIQPGIVGEFDFIPQTSSDQLSDPIAMQQNFFSALDKVTKPEWQQMLVSQGKMLNAVDLTQKVFDKLNLGLEEKDVLTDAPPPQMAPGAPGQPPMGNPQQAGIPPVSVPPMGGAAPQPAPAPMGIPGMGGPYG